MAGWTKTKQADNQNNVEQQNGICQNIFQQAMTLHPFQREMVKTHDEKNCAKQQYHCKQ